VVRGQVPNGVALAPQDDAAASRTVTSLRTESSPRPADGSAAYNEIALDDQQGSERISLRAERDLQHLVKHNDDTAVGGNRTVCVAGHLLHHSRSAVINEGELAAVMSGANSFVWAEKDVLVLSSKGSSITLSEKGVTILSAVAITLSAPRIDLNPPKAK